MDIASTCTKRGLLSALTAPELASAMYEGMSMALMRGYMIGTGMSVIMNDAAVRYGDGLAGRGVCGDMKCAKTIDINLNLCDYSPDLLRL